MQNDPSCKTAVIKGGAGSRDPKPTGRVVPFPAWFFDGEVNRRYAHDDDLYFNIEPVFTSAGFEIQFYSIENAHELFTFVTHFKPILANLIKQGIRILGGPIRFMITIKVTMTRDLFHDNQGSAETVEFYLNSKFRNVRTIFDVYGSLTDALEQIMRAEDNAESEGSTYCISGVEIGILKILKYEPLVGHGDGFMLHRDVALYLKDKMRAIINVQQNTDDSRCNCLLQCILAKKCSPQVAATAVHAINPDLASSYHNLYQHLNVEGITNFPIGLSDFHILENNNDISINVYTYEECLYDIDYEDQIITDYSSSSSSCNQKTRKLLPLRVSERKPCMECNGDDERCVHTIDLLLLHNFYVEKPCCSEPMCVFTGDHCKTKRINHYVLIKSLKRFLFSKNKSKNFICRRCFSGFTLFSQLKWHYDLCYSSEHTAQAIDMPSDADRFMRFTQQRYEIALPFVCYLDFEAFLQNVDTPQLNANGKTALNTRRIQKHVPCMYSFCIVSDKHEMVVSPYTFYSSDPKFLIEDLIDTLLRFFRQLKQAYKKSESPLLVTAAMEELRDAATHCGTCNREFGPNAKKIFNHRHRIYDVSDPDYLKGITCVSCNLEYKTTYKMPVICHNFSGYDGKFIIQYLKKFQKAGMQVNVLAKSTEKFLSIRVGPLDFKDSMSFISGSLDAASTILKEDQYKFTRQLFPNPEHFALMKHKIPFPYNSFKNNESATRLPALLPKNAFYNNIKKTHISDDQYSKLGDIVRTFNLNSLLDLAKHYVKSDVILLADIMTQLRIICFNLFRLDMLHYLSLGSLSWSYMLKNTKASIELTQDVNVYLFVERAIYGGLSFVNNGRYFESNNKDVGNLPVDATRASALFLTDVNSLYGNTQYRNKLYIGGAHFLSEDEVKFFDLCRDVQYNSETGYLVECTVEINERLHPILRHFPILPRKRTIKLNDLSPHTRLKLSELGITLPAAGVTRLIADLNDKEKYIAQGVLLKWCVEKLGVTVRDVTRVLKFKQTNWLNAHVEQLLLNRIKHKDNPLLNKLCKLCANALFGKSCEDCRKYRHVKIVNSQKSFLKLAAQTYFKNYKKLNDDTYLVELKPARVRLCRPNLIGQQILDLSRLRMYELAFDHILPHYLGNDKSMWGIPRSIENNPRTYDVQIVYSDTDSLLLHVQFPVHFGHYDCLQGLGDILDTSDFAKDHPLYRARSPLEKMGLLKIEGYPQRLLKAVLIKSKLYTLLYEGENGTTKQETKCKGATYNSAKDITFQNFVDCIDHNIVIRADQTSIRSYNSQLYTVITSKQILQSIDYKNYYFNDRECCPWGDKQIRDHQRFLKP